MLRQEWPSTRSDIIATMVRARLQHVDPALIAMSFPENNERQAAATVVEQPPGHVASLVGPNGIGRRL